MLGLLRRSEHVCHGVDLPLLLLRQLHVRRHEARHVRAEISENVTRTAEEEGGTKRTRIRKFPPPSPWRCIMRMRALGILGEELAPISRNLIDKCRSHESITTNHQNGAPKCRVVYIANTPTRLSAAACSQICRLVSRNTCFV